MIATIQPITAGNALRLFMQPPSGAVAWRVLRKAADEFAGEADPTAFVAYEGSEKVFIDAQYLKNEILVYYRPYYFDGVSWTAGATQSGTPAATFEELTTDVLSFVRDRLEAGLLVAVERGLISAKIGHVPVYTAPPSLERDLPFPLVTVHLDSESPDGRGIGEEMSGDEFYGIDDEWVESEGWLASVQLTIMVWSLNPDERIALRKALRSVIITNLPVFDDQGFIQINFSQQDMDAVNGEYGTPVYQVLSTFSCLAPVRVGARRVGSTISSIESIIRSTNG